MPSFKLYDNDEELIQDNSIFEEFLDSPKYLNPSGQVGVPYPWNSPSFNTPTYIWSFSKI